MDPEDFAALLRDLRADLAPPADWALIIEAMSGPQIETYRAEVAAQRHRLRVARDADQARRSWAAFAAEATDRWARGIGQAPPASVLPWVQVRTPDNLSELEPPPDAA